MMYSTLKRLFDFIGALIAIAIFLPIIIVVYLYLKITNGSVIFHQKRIGLNKKEFSIYKFKTMTDKKDNLGVLLPDKDRLTKTGKFLRKTSLDELPQLFNVLKGSMSIVGPRPLLPEYLPLYTEEQNKRHNVKPGITGWAQVNGRNTISWDQKFKYDVWYVNNQSLLLDIKIIIKTIIKVIKKSDINQKGQATSEPFKGSNNE